MRRVWTFGALLGVAAAAAGGLALRGRGGGAAGSAGDFREVHPEEAEVREAVNATGPVRLKVGSEVRVGSQLSGIVKRLNVTVGSHVRAGEVIAEIDDRPLRARLADAEAQAELDRAAMEHARADHARAQRLARDGLIPAQQEDDLRLALVEAEAKYRKSLRDCDMVRVDLGYVQIRAPISGTVASVSTQEGETVAAAFAAPTFVTIIADHALELVAMVDETDIANVKAGDAVTFTVDAYPTRDFPGVVRRIAPKATIVSGVVNYEVGIEIRRDAELLKPDMTANVSIQTPTRKALLLPMAAIQHEGDAAFVYLAGGAGPVRRPVTLGSQQNGMVEIRKGVATVDTVLVRRAAAGGKNAE